METGLALTFDRVEPDPARLRGLGTAAFSPVTAFFAGARFFAAGAFLAAAVFFEPAVVLREDDLVPDDFATAAFGAALA